MDKEEKEQLPRSAALCKSRGNEVAQIYQWELDAIFDSNALLLRLPKKFLHDGEPNHTRHLRYLPALVY